MFLRCCECCEETCHVVQTSEPSTVWRDARALQVSTIVFRRAWRPHFLALRKIASRYNEELHRVSAQLRTQPLLRNSAAKCSGGYESRVSKPATTLMYCFRNFCAVFVEFLLGAEC